MKENFLILIDFTRRLYKSRYMLRMLAIRELKASYAGSAFGLLWAVFNPLVYLAVYGIVFGIFFRSTPDPVYGTQSYFLFLLCGLVPWQFFSQTINSSAGTLVKNFSLIKKAVGFPAEILPIVTVISNLISHLISLALLVLVVVFSAGLTPFVLLVFVYLFLTAVFSIGLGWIISGINVFLRDIEQMLGLVMMGWLFFTPIFYSPGFVPEKYLFIMKLNPMYHMVEGYRLALLTGRALPPADFIYFAAVSVVTFGAGGMFFRKLKPWFAEFCR
jgi:ABC-type polysaccharide/polyol phosphate export permease